MRGHPCNDASGPALGVPAEDSGLMSVDRNRWNLNCPSIFRTILHLVSTPKANLHPNTSGELHC